MISGLAQFLIGILLIVITCIITFYFTSRTNTKKFSDDVTLELATHIKFYHEISPYKLIEKHKVDCESIKYLPEIKDNQIMMRTALVFLVAKAGGNPKDLGLFDN